MESPKNDYEFLQRLAEHQCTIEEAASHFHTSVSSFKKRLNADARFREIWERSPAIGRASLRKLQWRHASGFGPHAVAMTIHLSKHWLGETDKTNVEISGSLNINATRTATDIMLDGIKTDLLSKEETIELAELCDMVDESGVGSLSTPQRVRFFSLVNKGTPATDEEYEHPAPVEVLSLPPPEQT